MVHAHDGAAVAEVALDAVVAATSRLCVSLSGSDVMASLVLSSAGGAVGGALFGPFGAMAGAACRRDRRRA